ncbi:MAG TPA: TauD/TfdA family dioxygenase, partial [Stellaceae bacterium]|nr:TauD/TfdA family dioxygenase [Stellaceae bacterium]
MSVAAPPRPLIEGPSAWIGAELARHPETWIYQLSPAEIAELEAAVAKVRGLDLADLSGADFALPTLAPVLDGMRKEVLNGRGFVLIRGLPVEGKSIEDSAAAYWAIGTRFGNPRSQNAMGHLLGHVRDLGVATTDPNVRTYQTTERQHFHTDSCDIVGLLCLKTAKSGGLSSIVSSMAIYNEMAKRRPDLARRPEEWIYTLSPAEIGEIEAAVAQVRGRDLAGLTRADFALPTLAPTLDRMREEVLNGRGFLLIRGLPVEGRPIADSAAAYWAIGSYFGNPRSQNAMGHLLGHVRDLGLATTDPNVRTYQTTERQHFHTDSCDIVGLLCLKTAKSGGLSSIVSSMAIYNEMAKRRPDLLARLFRPFATDRRGEVPVGEKPYFNTPVFNEHAGYVSGIYSGTYIRSAQRFAEVPRFTAEDVEALEML